MPLTNNQNLPDIIFKGLAYYNEARRKGQEGSNADYSVTELLQPACYVTLKKRHAHEIEQDVSDMLYLLQGQVIHQLMENAHTTLAQKLERVFITLRDTNDDRVETLIDRLFSTIKRLRKRMTTKLLIEQRRLIEFEGYTISGTPDALDLTTNTLLDYKYAGVKSAQNNKEKYFDQTNIYRYMLRKAGYQVDKVEIILFYRDWMKTKSWTEFDYPKAAIESVTAPIYSDSKVEQLLTDKLEILGRYAKLSTPDLYWCSPDERFQNPDKFAVMRGKNIRASKVFDTREEAQAMIDSTGWDAVIQERKSEPKKCISYCDVNQFCPFYQAYKQELIRQHDKQLQGENNDN